MRILNHLTLAQAMIGCEIEVPWVSDKCSIKMLSATELSWACVVVWCAMSTRFPFLLYFAAKNLILSRPSLCMWPLRLSLRLGSNWLLGSIAFMSRTRLGWDLDTALEAYMRVSMKLGPLPWALGLPVGERVLAVGAFAFLALGWRLATDLVRAWMKLLIARSSSWSCLKEGMGLEAIEIGIPNINWKVGCV